MRPPSFGTSDVIKGTVINVEDMRPGSDTDPRNTDGPAGAGPSGAVESS